MTKIFFQSSLPRSGSTLLQNILAQNPDFYATPTSGLIELLHRSKNAFSDSPEFKAQDKKLMNDAFLGYCKGAIEGYFKNITNKKYVIDKSRGWGINYNFLNMFYDDPKIVCMIRDLRDVYASMEKNYRKNPNINSGIVINSELKGTTVEKRIDHWSVTPPIGLSLDWIKDMILQGIHKKVLFIKYEDLIKNPKNELKKIYNFFEIKEFSHNFNNIEQITIENDQIHGIFGDHKIKNKLTPVKSDAINILGQHGCNWIRSNYDWFYNQFNYF